MSAKFNLNLVGGRSVQKLKSPANTLQMENSGDMNLCDSSPQRKLIKKENQRNNDILILTRSHKVNHFFNNAVLKPYHSSIELPFHIPDDDNACEAFVLEYKDDKSRLKSQNLFLQEPVLNLQIDKQFQPSAHIEINKMIKVEPKFPVANPKDTFINLNKSCNALDNSSCDSGVELENKRQSKPTTPHRILCQFRTLDRPIKNEQNDEICLIKRNNNNNENKLNKQTNKKQKDNKVNVKRDQELTNFFPVRRSCRKTKSAVKEEMIRNLEKSIKEQREDGLMVKYFDGKGRGVVAVQSFKRGEFVVEYTGELIEVNEANDREKKYSLDEKTGCYMYYFKFNNMQYCIDATDETGKLGRLVNHSRNGNLVTKVVEVGNRPHLVLIAKDDIAENQEITYDYGDRSRESLLHHPWLAL